MTVSEWLQGADIEALEKWLDQWEDIKKHNQDGTEVIFLDAPPPDRRLMATREDIEAALWSRRDT